MELMKMKLKAEFMNMRAEWLAVTLWTLDSFGEYNEPCVCARATMYRLLNI